MKQQGSTGKQEKLRESRRRRSANDRRRSEKARLERLQIGTAGGATTKQDEEQRAQKDYSKE